MGEFHIEFARGGKPGPEYKDYSVTVISNCGDDPQPRRIRFNDINAGDFVVGYQWDNPWNGQSPVYQIRFESFTDETIEIELATGNQTVVPVPPATLRDSLLNQELFYPYYIAIGSLPYIEQYNHAGEIACPGDLGTHRYVRTRKIQYLLADAQGNWGPLRTATFINNNNA